MKPFVRCISLAACVLISPILAQSGRAELILNYKNGDKTGWYKPVDIQTSTVALNPADPISVSLNNKTVKGYFDQAVKDSNIAKNNNWATRLTFQVAAAALTGKFYVDVYYPQHSTPTKGGAQFLVRYAAGPGENAAFIKSLQWVQIIKTDDANGNERGPYPDVYNSGYARGQALPFYYFNQTKLDPSTYVGTPDIYQSSYNLTFNGAKNATNLKYDLAFWDWPQREPNHSWSAGLFLGSYTPPPMAGKPGTVTMYSEGIFWGFNVSQPDAGANPEPSSLVIAALAIPLLIAGSALRRRESRRLEEA
jgi:hypothetical protein